MHNNIKIFPDPDFIGKRYFIPYEYELKPNTLPINMGIYANDLAYNKNIENEISYQKETFKNILRLVWRLEFNEKKHCTDFSNHLIY